MRRRKFKPSDLIFNEEDLLALEEGMWCRLATTHLEDRRKAEKALRKVQNLIYLYQSVSTNGTPNLLKVIKYLDLEDEDECSG